jgi:ADP-heptose:LPS heptosyltransferase
MSNNINILISRTDSIGDVVLTLPLAGILKQKYPYSKVFFLGKSYTKDIILLSKNIDKFLDWTEIEKLDKEKQIEKFKTLNIDVVVHVFPVKEIAVISKKAKIKTRIGTSHRIFNLLTCNKPVNFSRKNSPLHEAQLNVKLLKPLGITKEYEKDELIKFYGLKKPNDLKKPFNTLLDNNRVNVILHTKSKGSAREWGLENFKRLIKLLPEDKYKVFLSGTEDEGKLFRKKLIFASNVVDISGQMTLSEFISFINAADVLIAASTGPLHIAAALGKATLGIYPPIKPMHPGRWGPLGENAYFIVKDNECSDCRKGGSCHCMLEITPLQVKSKLEHITKNFHPDKF